MESWTPSGRGVTNGYLEFLDTPKLDACLAHAGLMLSSCLAHAKVMLSFKLALTELEFLSAARRAGEAAVRAEEEQEVAAFQAVQGDSCRLFQRHPVCLMGVSGHGAA